MSEYGFTPGPWVVDDYGCDFDGARFGEVAYILSKEGDSFDATEANARLISAAPDLLEALVLMYKEAELADVRGYGWDSVRAKSLNAIVKAVGIDPDIDDTTIEKALGRG